MKITYKILGLLIIFLSILTIKINAATTSISTDKNSVNVGDTVTVTVKYTAAAWNLTVSADSGLTTASQTKYADSSELADNVSKSFEVVYKATKAGTFNIKLSGDVTDESSNKSDPVSKSTSIKVVEKSTTNTTTPTTQTTTKSSNANLKTLGVTPKEYDFSGFSKSKTSYNVIVPSSIDSLKVVYKTEDSKASVKVTGNSGFDIGSNNNIKIVVTAEDGKTTKTYNIKVTKLATDEDKPGNVIDETDQNTKIYLTNLEIDGIKLTPEFSNDVYVYTATLEDNTLTDLVINAKANIENAKIDISGNTGLVNGENTINIIVSTDSSSSQAVYQITVKKEAALDATNVQSITGETSKGGILDSIMQNWKKYVLIAVLILVLIIFAIILLVYLIKKENKKLNQIQEHDENKDQEYDVYKNDSDEFDVKDREEIKKQTEKIFKPKTEEVKNDEELEDDAENMSNRKKGRHF